MIAFKNNFPLLRKARGQAMTFRRTWLRNALKRAAAKAGYTEWWIAEDLAQSVSFYLEYHYLQPVIAVPLLENAVRSALMEIGYEEVAHHFGSTATLRSASLLSFLPSSAAVQGQSQFYIGLATWIRAVSKSAATTIALTDLDACVARLTNLTSEGGMIAAVRNSSELRNQIIEFVHAQIFVLSSEDFLSEIRCSLR